MIDVFGMSHSALSLSLSLIKFCTNNKKKFNAKLIAMEPLFCYAQIQDQGDNNFYSYTRLHYTIREYLSTLSGSSHNIL